MLTPVNPENPRCYLDISIDGEDAGRLVVELFLDQAPKTVENFRALCTGEYNDDTDSGAEVSTDDQAHLLHFERTAFHRVEPGKVLVGGDISRPRSRALSSSEALAAASQSLRADPVRGAQPDSAVPSGGESAFGGRFAMENVKAKHARAGLLSMEPTRGGAGEGARDEEECCGSQFAITLGPCKERDGRCCVFGRVVRGYGALREVERVATASGSGAPLAPVVIVACGQLHASDDGVRVGADGDPFPPWPQDHCPSLGSAGEDYITRVAAAQTIKSFGNEAFQDGDFRRAASKYSKALRYLEKVYTREAEVYAEEQHHRHLQRQHQVPLLLNSAAARMKLGDFRGAIADCDQVHAVENEGRNARVAGEAWNPKMLYRRGQSRVMCSEFEEGIADLYRASLLDPQNQAIRRQLHQASLRMQARKERERNAYSKMFG